MRHHPVCFPDFSWLLLIPITQKIECQLLHLWNTGIICYQPLNKTIWVWVAGEQFDCMWGCSDILFTMCQAIFGRYNKNCSIQGSCRFSKVKRFSRTIQGSTILKKVFYMQTFIIFSFVLSTLFYLTFFRFFSVTFLHFFNFSRSFNSPWKYILNSCSFQGVLGPAHTPSTCIVLLKGHMTVVSLQFH